MVTLLAQDAALRAGFSCTFGGGEQLIPFIAGISIAVQWCLGPSQVLGSCAGY